MRGGRSAVALVDRDPRVLQAFWAVDILRRDRADVDLWDLHFRSQLDSHAPVTVAEPSMKHSLYASWPAL